MKRSGAQVWLKNDKMEDDQMDNKSGPAAFSSLSSSSARSASSVTSVPTWKESKRLGLSILDDMRSWVESWPENDTQTDDGIYMFCCDLIDLAEGEDSDLECESQSSTNSSGTGATTSSQDIRTQ